MLLGLMINTKKKYYNSNNHISIEWNAHFMGWCVQHATWACWDIQSAYFTSIHPTLPTHPFSLSLSRFNIRKHSFHLLSATWSIFQIVWQLWYVLAVKLLIFSVFVNNQHLLETVLILSQKIDFIFDKFSEKCDDEMLT